MYGVGRIIFSISSFWHIQHNSERGVQVLGLRVNTRNMSSVTILKCIYFQQQKRISDNLQNVS